MKNVSQGSVVRITATFRTSALGVADPSVVTFYIESEGDGTSDTYVYGAAGSPIVRSSTGVYYFDQDTSDISGLYDWRVVGTGTTNGSQQGQFYVTPSNVDDSSSSCSDESS